MFNVSNSITLEALFYFFFIITIKFVITVFTIRVKFSRAFFMKENKIVYKYKIFSIKPEYINTIFSIQSVANAINYPYTQVSPVEKNANKTRYQNKCPEHTVSTDLIKRDLFRYTMVSSNVEMGVSLKLGITRKRRTRCTLRIKFTHVQTFNCL